MAHILLLCHMYVYIYLFQLGHIGENDRALWFTRFLAKDFGWNFP